MADKEAREPGNQDRDEPQTQDGGSRQMPPEGQAHQQPDEETLDQAVVLGADQYDQSAVKHASRERSEDPAPEEELDPSLVLDRDQYDQNAIRRDGVQRSGEPEPEEALGRTAALNRDQYSQSEIAAPAADTDTTITRRSDPESRNDGPEQQEESLGRTAALNRDQYSQSAINQPSTQTETSTPRRSEPTSRISGTQKPEADTFHAQMPKVDRTEESVLIVQKPSVRVVIGDRGGPAPVRRVEGKEPPAEEASTPEPATRVNQAPVANADRGEGRADSQFEIDVLANDTDGNADDIPATFTLDQVQIVGNTGPAGSGQVAIVNNRLVFTPGSDFDALAEGETATVTVRYQMSDDEGASASSTATVIVTGVNAAPDAADDTLLVQEGGSHTFTVADFGFRDIDTSDSLQSVTITRLPAAGSLTLNSVAVTTGQVITAEELATLTFTPENHANGDGYADLQFTVSDGRADSPVRTLTIDVGEVNDAPTAQDKTLSINEDGSHTFAATDFGFNDIDTGDTLQSVTITRLPSVGSLTLNDTPVSLNQVITAADIGNLKYAPASHASGTSYADLQFTVSDGELSSSAQTVTFNVTPVTDAPTVSLGNNAYAGLELDTDLISNGDFSASGDWAMTGAVEIFSTVNALAFGRGGAASDGVAEQSVQGYAGVNYSLALDFRLNGIDTASGKVEVIDSQSGAVLADQTFSSSSTTWQTLTLPFTANSSGNLVIRISDTTGDGPATDLLIDNVSLEASSIDNTALGVTAQEDQAIAVDLSVATPDSDGSETLAIELSGIPSGVVLGDGTNTLTSTGAAIDVSDWDLGSLTLTPPANNHDDFTVTVKATATETATGTTSVTNQAISVHIASVNDAPVLPTLETQGLRGEVFETGSGIPNLATVDNLIASQAATATFTATELNYSGGTTLSGFLGDDGNSLSGSQNLTPETFGIRLTGWIEMPAGTHSFTINSDDGVRLTIGNEVVIEQDGTAHFTGLNGQYTATESGLVPIEIIYYEHSGGQVLEISSSLTGNAALDTSVLSTSALTLDAIAEDIDGASNTGTTVSAFLQDVTIGDVDGSAQDAIAITSVDDSNGTWQYSRDNGATWTAVDDGALAENHALLLAGSDQFRFVPDANYHGPVAFDFRAWDQSSGTAGSYADTSTNGGTTAFSQQSGEGHLFVNPVNDVPVSADKTLTITEDGSHNFAAADFGFTDADSGDTLQSVTITQLPAAGSLTLNGTDVTLNQTINATDIGNLVFTPVANAHGDDYADLQFTVSDGSDSSTAKTLTFDVTSTPDPLVQTGQGLRGELFDAGSIPNLTTMDNLIATETPVATFTASSLNYQNGANVEGFLGTDGASLTGSQTLAPETFGIRLSGFIRVPAGTHDFTINADDGVRLTIGGEVVIQQDGTGMFNGLSGQYVATEPGLVPIEIIYYDHTGQQNFQVTSSLTGGGTLDNSVLFAHALPAMAEDLDAATNTGTRVSDLLTDGTITDGDGAVPESMAITSVDDSNGAWQYSRDGGTSWQAVDDGSLAENHALLLADTDLLRFVPNTHYSGAASFDFRAWDQTSGTAGSYADTSSNGGTTAFSTAISSAAVEITPVTDAPAVTLNNSGSNEFLLDTELITNGSVNGTDGWDFSGNVAVVNNSMVFSGANRPVTGVVEQSFTVYQDVNYALNLDYRSWNTNLVSARVEIVDSASGTVLASQNVSSNTASLQALNLDFTGIATGNALLRITDTTPNTNGSDLVIDNVSIQAPSADNDAMPAVVSGQEDQAIAVDLTVATPDSDGSETLAIELSGIPSGVVLSDGTNTLTSTGAAIDASGWNLGSLTLTPQANNHDDFTVTVKATATETATGATNVTNEAITVHIEAVNDAPTAQDKTLSISEDGSHTFAAADFGFDDIDTGDTLQSVTITRLPSVGSLTLNDTPVTLNQVITASDIGNLKYAPAAHASGDSYADLQFTVSDGGLSSSAQTVTFNVSPVTDAPAITLNNNDISLDTELITNGSVNGTDGWDFSGNVVESNGLMQFSGWDSPVTGVVEQSFDIFEDVNYALNLDYRSWNTNLVSGLVEIVDSASGTVLASRNFSSNTASFQALSIDFTGIATGNALLRITDTTANTVSRDLAIDNVSIQAPSADNNSVVSGQEDQAIAVDLTVATPDSDGSETLAIALSGIPSGIELSDGTNTLTSTGAAIDVSDWDLGSLTLTPPANNHDDFTFTVQATATETATGTTNVTNQAINVHIEAVNDPPVIAEGDTVDTSAAFVFSEGTGTTVADQSGNDNAMTLSGTATWGTGHDGTGNALEMDGSSSAAINGLETGGAMTVAAWVEFDATGNWSRVIDFGDGAGVNNIVLGSHVENGLGVHIFNGAGQLVGQLRVEDVITANQWTHVAFTVDDAGQITLYVDGASVGTATMTTGAPPEVLVRSNNLVGADNWNANQRLDGRLDDLLIANESLDANEISNLYRTGQLSDFTDAHFSLDEHSANGTVVGQVSATDVEDGTSLTYALADDAGGRFAINSTTGEITVADGSLLDHDVAGSHTLRVRVTDSGGLSSERDFVVQVADVSEAPTAQDKTLTITEDGSHTFAATDFGFSDGDSGDTLQSVTITQLPSAGSLTLDDSPVTANQVITAADITQLKFTPDANANGTGYADLTFTVSDGSLSSAAQTLTFDVTAVNDPPVIAEGDTVDTSAAFVFSEGTGTTVADESGNNNAMTLSGTATWGTGHGGTGNALEMDGSSSAAINGLETGGAMTVAAWVEFDATGGWSRIIDFGNGAAQHNILLGSNVENGLGVHIYNGTGQLIGQLEVPDVIAANQWAHVAFTIDDAGEITLYVDGESVGTATTTTGAPPEVLVRSNNLVGNDNWGGSQRLDGRLDDLVVVNESLDANQISNLYQASELTDFTDAHFTLDENSANGTVVGQVSGSDAEDGTNVTYALADDAGGRFAINSTTGEITVADSSLLDHETDGSHTLRVRVTDSGGLSSERDFVVQVADVNEAISDLTFAVDSVHADPTPTPLSEWNFDNSYDSEAGSNSFSGASPTFVTGPNAQVENAIHFDGGNTAFLASAAVSETSSAIGLWFRTTGSGTLMEITTASSLGSHDRNVWIDSNGRINSRLWASTSGEETITSTDTFNDGEWHYLVFSYGGDLGGQTLFVDGENVASGNFTSSAFDWQDSIRLGSSVSTTFGGFTGDIGGLQVFDQALTANDVATAMLRPDAVIDENTATAVTIGTLSLVDPDSADEAFGQHTYTVSDNRFEVVNGELRLKAAQSLDHETESSIEITVTATDNNNTGFTRSETFMILVQDVNEAPTAQDKTLSLNEDESHTFAAADFGFSDEDDGDSLQSVTITRLPSDGSLTLNDVAVTANDVIAATDLGNLKYTPAANAHGTGYADLQFTASDGTAASAVQTLTFDVASVNDAPVFDDGPVAQHEWHFDNSYDSEAGSQAFAGATPTYTSGPPNSQFANAIEFDGSATTFNVPLNVSETAYTVSFWFRADNAGGLLQIEGGGHDRNVYLNANGTITARVWQEESITSTVGETYNDGEWHHVVHTFGGAVGGQTLYVDGGEVASGTMTASGFTTQTHLRLGYSSMGNTHLDGAIAGLQVFDDAVTATEVQQLFAPDSVVTIDENTTTATTLTALGLTDPDSETDPFGQHTFTVSDNRFEVVSGELRLKAGQSLDHETEDRISVTVTATDNNGTGLSADKVFTILVQDANDAPEVADQTLTVAEDTAYHFSAADFSITDQDTDDTHTLTIEAINGGTLHKDPRPDLEFQFEESTGTTTDDDRNNVQGTLTGVTWATDADRGGIVTFDQNSDRITLAQPYDLGNEWTITTEFRNLRTDGATWQSLVEGSGDVQILVNSSTGEIGTWQNAVGFHGTGVNLSDLGNDWHSLTAVGRDGKTHFYLDDNYLGTADYQSTGIIDTIGNNSHSNAQAFAENLNNFRIYNTAQLADLDVPTVQGSETPILNLDFEDSANLANDPDNNITGTGTSVTQVNDAEQGNVLQFDASSDRIVLDQPLAIGNEWTITTRFKNLHLGTGSIGALTRNSDGDLDIQVEVSDAGMLGTRDRGSNTFHSSGFDMSTLSADWHTLTAVGSGGKTYFYVDNVHVGTSDYQSTESISSIGNGPSLNYPFAEFLDDFQVYDTAYFGNQGQVLPQATEVNAGDTVAAEDASDLRFVPDQDTNGDAVASIDFKATDNHGADSTTETLTFNVTPVNDAPVLSTTLDTAVSNEAMVNTETDSTQNEAVLTPMADGGYLAVWHSTENSGHAIKAQKYGYVDETRIITIADHSFESFSSSDGPAAVVNPSDTPWIFGGGGSGIWDPESVHFTQEAPDGDNVAFNNVGQGISQTLTERFSRDTTYQLQVDIGNRGDLAGMANYAVRITAGGVVLATDGSVSPAEGQWETLTLNLDGSTIAENSAALGQPITIELLHISGTQMHFDNVRLNATTTELQPEGPEYQIDTATLASDESVSQPQVATLDNGSYAVAWRFLDPGSLSQTKMRIFASDGTEIQSEFIVDSASGNNYTPDLVALTDNRFLVAHTVGAGSINAVILDAEGNTLQTTSSIGTLGGWGSPGWAGPEATALNNGGFALVWRASGDTADDSARIQFFDSDGNNTTGELSFGEANPATDRHFEIDTLENGEVVTVYQSGDNLFFQRWSETGTEQGSPVQINTSVAPDISTLAEVSIEALSDGGFFVVWRSTSQDADGTQGVYGRRFDASGNPLTGEIAINSTSADNQFDPSVVQLESGALQVLWTSNQDGNDNIYSASVGLGGNQVNENAGHGTLVGRASATDVDDGDTLTYELVNDAGGRFAIDASTGDITVVDGTRLDHETDASLTIRVRVTDSGGLTAEQDMVIQVQDVNDAPDISAAVTVTAPENLDAHTVTEAFLLGNASDVDGDTLSVQDVSINGVTAHRHDFQTSFSAGTGGSVAINGNTLTLTSGAEENVVLIDTTGGGTRGTDLHLDFTAAPTDGNATRNNFIVFDYVDANNYKTIGSYDGSGNAHWVVEQWTNGSNTRLSEFQSNENSNINTGRHYEIDIIDNRVSLTVDGVEKIAHQFSENISDGELGVMNRGNAVSTYTLNGADWDIYPDNQHAVYDNNDGTWTILSGDDLAGDLTLDYNVSDGELTTAATAVIPVDRSPDASIELSDTTGISDDVLPVETTAGGDPLTVTSVNGQTVATSGTTSIDGEFGTLDIAANGSWTYNLDAAYASVDLDSDLLARWTFDEGTGSTVADSSTVDSIADNGTLNGATFVSDGVSGGAVAFDGSNDRIDVANSTELNIYTGTKSAYTISLAFKVDPANDLTGTQVLYEQGGSVNGINIYIRDGNLYVGAWSETNSWNGAYVSTSLTDLEDGWHSVSLVLDATSATASQRTLTGYLDGTAFGTQIGVEGVRPHGGAIAFGGLREDTQIDTGDLIGDGNYFQGEIDEARIYNRALTDAEARVLGQMDKSETFTYDVSDGTHTSTATLAIDVQHTLDSTDGISGTVGDETLTGTAFGERIEGLAGMDTLIGNDGDDFLVGGLGNDTMTGGTGSDTFVWIAGHEGTASSVAIDTITDFNATPGGDAIDLSLLLTGETEATLDQYLNVSVTGGNTEIDVTPAGTGGDVTQKIILQGVDLSGLGDNTAILNTLLQNGNLHIDG